MPGDILSVRDSLGLVCARASLLYMCMHVYVFYACVTIIVNVCLAYTCTCTANPLPISISPFEVDEHGHMIAKMCGDQFCVVLLIVDIVLVRVVGMGSYSVFMRGLGCTCVGFSVIGPVYASLMCYIILYQVVD